MKQVILGVLAVALLALAALGCEVTADGVPPAPGPATAQALPTAPPVPATPPPTVPTTQVAAPAAAAATTAPAGDLAATRIAVPLAELDSDALRAALEGGGWTAGSITASRSSMLAINASATKGETRARISYYRPGDDFWVRRLERDGAAIHREGEVVLGVVIEGNPAGAQVLLGSLVGSGT